MADITIQKSISADDFAWELQGEEGFFLDLIAEMASTWKDLDFRRLKRAHSLSEAHQSVAPFLEQLAETLRQEEAASMEE